MTKYQQLKADLETTGTGQMKCFGNSMLPKIESGALLTFVKRDEYEVGDVVFCKVKGRYIDAHKITKKGLYPDGKYIYMIANNRGHENGWTFQVFGKVVF